MKPRVSLKRINKSFEMGDTTIEALQDINFDFPPDDLKVIAGPSGSGKSSLLNIIGCIDKPDSGRVEIDGKDVTDLSLEDLARLRREKLGFIFQSFNLVPVLSAYENVELPLLFRDLSESDVRSRVTDTLVAVGLGDRMNHRPAQLSGGQRQRVAIARALAGRPHIVIADEPTASLDSKTAHEIIDTMQRLNVEFGATILVASHDPMIMERASSVLKLQDGRIVSQ